MAGGPLPLVPPAYQAATIDVLNAMSASPGDAQLVFEAIARRAMAFCEADGTMETLLEDGMLHQRTHIGATQAVSAAYEACFPCPVDDSTTLGRAVLTRAPVHNPDLLADPGYRMKAISSVNSVRSNAAVPIPRGGVPIGAIGIAWLSVREFPGATGVVEDRHGMGDAETKGRGHGNAGQTARPGTVGTPHRPDDDDGSRQSVKDSRPHGRDYRGGGTGSNGRPRSPRPVPPHHPTPKGGAPRAVDRGGETRSHEIIRVWHRSG
jgi:hypothetical protein